MSINDYTDQSFADMLKNFNISSANCEPGGYTSSPFTYYYYGSPWYYGENKTEKAWKIALLLDETKLVSIESKQEFIDLVKRLEKIV